VKYTSRKLRVGKFIDDRELGKEPVIRVMSMRRVYKYVTKCEIRSMTKPEVWRSQFFKLSEYIVNFVYARALTWKKY